MMENPDVVIVGAGASAVSAAWPLINDGYKVLMLAPKKSSLNNSLNSKSFYLRRTEDYNQSLHFLGEDFKGIGENASETPKMKVPALRHIQEGYANQLSLTAENITPTGSLIAGGLTQMWGAGAFCYNDQDLEGFPISYSNLKALYIRVAKRIGISGEKNDAISDLLGADIPLQKPITLHPALADIYDKYNNNPALTHGFKFGRTRNAVLTKGLHNRLPCNLSNNCLWGCARKSIYSAAHEILQLKTHNNFQILENYYVEIIERLEAAKGGLASSYRIKGIDLTDHSPQLDITASSVLLAAGTISSTRLAMMMAKRHDVRQPICSHPAYATAGLNWRHIGAKSAREGFALGHLAYQVEDKHDPKKAAFGVLFPAEGLLMSDLASNMPFSMRGSIELTKALAPAMIVANGYLSSDYASCFISVEKNGTTKLSGSHNSDFEPAMKAVSSRLRQKLFKLGIVPLPGATRAADLGSDGHYAGGLPMQYEPHKKYMTTTPDGELRGFPGVFVVDGASLSKLSLKHPTFTMMANADRISSLLSLKLARAMNAQK